MQWLHVYVIDCKFSVKFDIFSFGVLLLEIVAGIKNRGFYHSNYHHNLLGHASRKNENPPLSHTHQRRMPSLAFLRKYMASNYFRHGCFGNKTRPWK